MVIFGVITKNEYSALDYFHKWFIKLSADKYAHYFVDFDYRSELLKEGKLLTIIKADFTFNLPIYWGGYVLTIASLLFFGVTPILIVPLSISATRIFWTDNIYHNSINRGLRKNGYNDNIEFIKSDEILRRALLK